MSVEQKLSELGVVLPEAAKPVGAYVPAVRSGNLIFTAGQVPLLNGEIKYAGKVGIDVSEEEAFAAARICAVNCLAAIKRLTGSLDNIRQIVKVVGFVNCAPDFTAQPKVINGASELLGQLFAGGHARSAVGVSALPLNAAVELEMVVEVG